jgi:hypothetical protein
MKPKMISTSAAVAIASRPPLATRRLEPGADAGQLLVADLGQRQAQDHLDRDRSVELERG